MTQNLRIQNYTLKSIDSDVDSDFILPNSSTNDFTNNGIGVYIIDTRAFYTWRAASAGANQTDENPTNSLCPKEWDLPTSGEYQALMNVYGSNPSTYQSAPLLFTFQGIAIGTSFSDCDGAGFRIGCYSSNPHGPLWTSTKSSNTILGLFWYYHKAVSIDNTQIFTSIRASEGFGIRCIKN